MTRILFFIVTAVPTALAGCKTTSPELDQKLRERINQYETVVLTTQLDGLSQAEREMLPILMQAADIIDQIFWLQAFGPKDSLKELMGNTAAWEYALINYGPWGRLEGHTAFFPGFDDKPLGARFYPTDMTREEFDQWPDLYKTSPHTLVRRNENGDLYALPYSVAFGQMNQEVVRLLHKAARMADYPPFASYLEKLAQGFLTDDFRDSETAWMAMKNNTLDVIMRPLDKGEDRKFGYKAAYSCYIVVKDPEWSRRLERFAGMAANLQQRLPVSPAYKQETPGDASEILVYDALYYAGHCNAGPKIIALYLPRDPEVQASTGTRSMQLKNVMEAKFSEILLPIARMMIHHDQQQHISSDAFFMLTAFHEIAAALGISQTINGQGPVREALREYHGTIDATATDLMALYLIAQLQEMGEITAEELQQAYVTSFASIMRSSRFGTAGAHGIAGMIRFNIFAQENVFTRNETTQTYHVDVDKMKQAVEKALQQMLTLQGDGNYELAKELVTRYGTMPETLRYDINRINAAKIPVDVAFKQGVDFLDL